MENRISKRNVALVEKCVMSTIGIKGLFDAMPDCRHTLHIFSKPSAFYKSALKTPFSAVIFSLSALRTERRTGLSSLTELAINYPHMRRLVIADDDAEARLISALSPLPLDGVISKASSLDVLQDALFTSLNSARRTTERTDNLWELHQNCMLSPTEREILRFMSNGYSMPQIAVQLERNIKTIRAHKFNVMSKLGVSSDAGLLDAADILLYLRAGDATALQHRVWPAPDAACLFGESGGQARYWHTSTQVADVSSAILSGVMRTALCVAPAAGNTSSYPFREMSQ